MPYLVIINFDRRFDHVSGKDEDIQALIDLRINNDASFIGKRGCGKNAWARLATELNCGATGDQCQKKWLNLIAYYKTIIIPKTGISLEEDEHEAITWPFYDRISEFMSERHTINPVEIIDSVTPSTSGIGNATSRAKRPAMTEPAVQSDDEDTPPIAIRQRQRMKVHSEHAAALNMLKNINAQIDRSNAQVERSLDNQAEACRNQKMMMDTIMNFFSKK